MTEYSPLPGHVGQGWVSATSCGAESRTAAGFKRVTAGTEWVRVAASLDVPAGQCAGPLHPFHDAGKPALLASAGVTAGHFLGDTKMQTLGQRIMLARMKQIKAQANVRRLIDEQDSERLKAITAAVAREFDHVECSANAPVMVYE
jgi:hypothetical protein